MKKISTKDKVLNILDTHKGIYYSGQELADTLDLSRTAVWKAINTLREEGYDIVGSTKLGYALSASTDVLNHDAIIDMLNDEAKTFISLECEAKVDSTNLRVREKGLNGEKEGICIVAEEQSAGRGRKGRSFYSPAATGLYLSILLRPSLKMEDAVLITTAAAVAGAIACEKTNDSLRENDILIKWVNDLYLNGHKISGILTEANFSLETNGFDFAVMGIGFNLMPPSSGWPSDIKDRAGALFDEEAPSGARNKLTAEFLNEFVKIYKELPKINYLDEYRKRSMAIGRSVDVIAGDGSSKSAYVEGVNDRCELIVKYDGESETKTINSGEISIRI